LSFLFRYLLALIFPNFYFLVTDLIQKLRTLRKKSASLRQTFTSYFNAFTTRFYEFRTCVKLAHFLLVLFYH